MNQERLSQNIGKLPRILIISRQFRPLLGGAEKQVERLAEKFLQKGLSVRVLAARYEKSWPRRERLENGLEILRLPSPPVRAIGSTIFLFALFFYMIRHRHEYDIVHVQHAHYGALGSSFAAKLVSKPVICKIAGSGYTGDVAAMQRTPFPDFLRNILKKIDRFVVVSQETREELRLVGFSEQQITLIPNGVNTDFFCSSSRQAISGSHDSIPKRLVYVGRIAREKGLDVLLHALRLLDGIDRARLRVVGDGPLGQEMKELAAHLKILDRVEFLGQAGDVREHLRSADIFVLPSRSEGLSNALLEAMACGLPVVATKVSGTVDLIQHGENGLLAEVEDPKALAATIGLLLQDAVLARKLGENAAKTVRENYSLDSVAERYIALYKDLIYENA